jgi:hypothetical protein
MIRILLACLPCLLFPARHEPANDKFTSIEKELPLLWKSKMGAASYRTNMQFTGKDIIMGSNGMNFRDYNIMDTRSGVYFIDRVTGKVNRKIAGELIGDMDVNGIIEHQGKLYFGNDNEEFLCTSYAGDILWRLAVSGDIEHEPVMINIKGKTNIVFATEAGEVTAVDPLDGKILWSWYVPDYKGWKPEDNRIVFKVKAHFSNTTSFLTKPLLHDLDNDGVSDLIYMGFDSKIYAISGAKGKELWIVEDEYLETVFFKSGSGSTTYFMAVGKKYNADDHQPLELITINTSGKIVDRFPLDEFSWGGGLNHLSVSGGRTVFLTLKSLFIYHPENGLEIIDRDIPFRDDENPYVERRQARDPLIGNKVFAYGKEKNCVMILNQYDNLDHDYGFVEIISLDSKKVLKRLALKSRSEMPPVISDVNKDGVPDVLISGYDGYLYCYSFPAASIR